MPLAEHSPEERDTLARFEAAEPAPESYTEEPLGPGGCNAAINIKGEHFWCDNKFPHRGWPHGSTAAETIWRGSSAAEDPAAAWREVDPDGER